MTDVVLLLTLIDRFVRGETARATADEIEGLVLECFPDEPWFENVSLALAQYMPGGGMHYYDEAAVAQELKEASAALRAVWCDPWD